VSFFRWLEQVGITSHPGGWAATERLLSLLKLKPDDLAVELGCGFGRTLSYAAKEFSVQVVGVDLMPALASKACGRLKREKLRGFTVAADICRLPFRDETFTVAWAESVFVFLPKLEAFFEAARVLKPNGRFGIVELTWRDEPHPDYCEQTKEFLGVERYEVLTVQEWVATLRSAGFAVEFAEKMPSHAPPSPLHRWFSDFWDLARLGFGLARQLPAKRWLEGAQKIFKLFRYTVPGIFVAIKLG